MVDLQEERRKEGDKRFPIFFYSLFFMSNATIRVVHLFEKLPRIVINFFFHRFQADRLYERSSGMQRLVETLLYD